MINHHISDLVARLKNAGPDLVFNVFKTKDNYAILNILQSLGYLRWDSHIQRLCSGGPDHTYTQNERQAAQIKSQKSQTGYRKPGAGAFYQVILKELPSLKNIKVLSRPGRRVYLKVQDLKTQKQGMAWYIIRTSQGIMTSAQALELGLGGEALIKIQ